MSLRRYQRAVSNLGGYAGGTSRLARPPAPPLEVDIRPGGIEPVPPFEPSWTGVANIVETGSGFNIPSSNLPTGEEVIIAWIVSVGSPTPVLGSVDQLDAGLSVVGSMDVANYAITGGGLHIAWGTRHASLDSLETGFTAGYTGYGFLAANVPTVTLETVYAESYAGDSSISETLPGEGLFAAVAVKGSGLDFFDSGGAYDYTEDLSASPSHRFHPVIINPATAPVVYWESLTGSGYLQLHALGQTA